MQLKPETEQLAPEEIRSGHFHSVDELIVQGVHAWREKGRRALPGCLRNLRSRALNELRAILRHSVSG